MIIITLVTIIILLISIYYGIVFRNNFINWIIIIFLALLNIHNLKDKSVQFKKINILSNFISLLIIFYIITINIFTIMQSNTFFKTKTVEEFKINNQEKISVQQIINGGLLTNNYEIVYIRNLPLGLYCYSILDSYNLQDDYLTLNETINAIKDIDKGFCYHKIKLDDLPKITSKRKY